MEWNLIPYNGACLAFRRWLQWLRRTLEGSKQPVAPFVRPRPLGGRPSGGAVTLAVLRMEERESFNQVALAGLALTAGGGAALGLLCQQALAPEPALSVVADPMPERGGPVLRLLPQRLDAEVLPGFSTVASWQTAWSQPTDSRPQDLDSFFAAEASDAAGDALPAVDVGESGVEEAGASSPGGTVAADAVAHPPAHETGLEPPVGTVPDHSVASLPPPMSTGITLGGTYGMPTPAANPLPGVPDGPDTLPGPTDGLPGAPLRFERNVGQADAGLDFVAQAHNHQIWLAGSGLTLVTPQATDPRALLAALATDPAAGTTSSFQTVVQMQFVGGNADAVALGRDALPGAGTVFVDAAGQAAASSAFARVEYQELYPGVNVVYRSSPEGLVEWDAVVAPGTDPGAIRQVFVGASGVELDGIGNLVVHTAQGDVFQSAPVLYQEIGNSRQTVDGHYVVGADQSVQIVVGAYDTSKPLIIDPVIGFGGNLPALGLSELAVPTSASKPIDIARGPDGNLWFVEQAASKVTRVTPGGAMTEFALPAGSDPVDIWTGPDGNLWFTEFNPSRIGKMTPTGQVTVYNLAAGRGPNGITAGPDGNVWFTETLAHKIGRISPDGTITEFALPSGGQHPIDIALGADGNLWFPLFTSNQIGRMTPSGQVTLFAVPTAGAQPAGIAAAPDGALWFTEYGKNKIGRITTAGVITEYVVPTPNSVPYAINVGPDGNLWFAESASNQIGRLTLAGQFQEYAGLTAGSQPTGIIGGFDDSIWFTEYTGSRIGKLSLDLPQVQVTANPAAAFEQEAVAGAFVFTRTGDTSVPLTVNYTVGGTAWAGADYPALPGSVTFAAGASSATAALPPLPDGLPEPVETVVVTLAAGAGYRLGATTNATVTIADSLLPSSLVGSQFHDRDGDGVQDPGETGLAGWTVQLLNSGGQVLDTRQTAGDGSYSFTNLAPGLYTVRTLQQDGWTSTGGPAGGNVLVGSGGKYTADFGGFENLRISGFKFDDESLDGQWQPEEARLAGWTIELYVLTNGQLSATPVQTTLTDANGEYSFTNLGPLPPGSRYVVAEVLQPGWSQTAPSAATPNTMLLPSGARGYVIEALSGMAVVTESGQQVSISGTGSVRLNSLNNNTQATVTYNDGAGHSGTINTFLAQFNVTFTGGPDTPVTFDTFCVDLLHRVSVGQTYQVNARNDLATEFANGSGVANGSRIAYIFQNYGQRDLSGDSDEAAAVQLALWYLSLGTTPQAVARQGDGSYATTDGAFRFFVGANAAPIAARFNDLLQKSAGATAPGAWLDAAASGNTLQRGQSLLLPESRRDHANVYGARVGGSVWYDTDGSGSQAYDDYGMPEVVVRLLDSAGHLIASTISDMFGFYEFSRIPAGSYQLEFVAPANYEFIPVDMISDDLDSDADPVTGRTSLFSLAIGDNRSDFDAGLVWTGNSSISGQAWFDADSNGVRGPNEYGLADLPVRLLSADGAILSTTTTSTAGAYEFLDLLSGTYQVEFGLPSENGLSPANAAADDVDSDADPLTARTAHLVVGDGEARIHVDVGLIGSGVLGSSVGGRVWFDLNENGLQELDEPGAAGETVRLLDATGAVLQATTSDMLGQYRFFGLDSDRDYQIQFDNPDLGEYDFTQQFAGEPESDSDVDQFGYTGFFQAGVPGADKDAGLKKAVHVCDADPAALATVTSKSVPWPQTGIYKGGVTFYWGVALYIDQKGLDELAKAKGGYIVSKRTITWKIGDNAEQSTTVWHLNQISVNDGKLVPNNNFSKEQGKGEGGPRSMADGSTSLTYFSVINTPGKGFEPIPYLEKTGKVTVELTWKLYKCPPDAATLAKFPNVGIDQSNIGWDEYVHTKWTTNDPKITVKPLAEGKIDAAIAWTAVNNQSISFTSSNKDIQEGPNRKDGRPYFRGWEYKDGKWQER